MTLYDLFRFILILNSFVTVSIVLSQRQQMGTGRFNGSINLSEVLITKSIHGYSQGGHEPPPPSMHSSPAVGEGGSTNYPPACPLPEFLTASSARGGGGIPIPPPACSCRRFAAFPPPPC